MNDSEIRRAKKALNFIIPYFEKHGLRWVITTGFACYLHGVSRPLNDIDIDLAASVESDNFRAFLTDMKCYVHEPLQNFVDQNYDNWCVDLMIEGVVLDICTADDIKLFSPVSKSYEYVYPDGLPEGVIIRFEGLSLPVSSIKNILKEKSGRVFQRHQDQLDIEGLKKLSP